MSLKKGIRLDMPWAIIIFVIFLILWGLAWRKQPKLAIGIFIGLFVGAAIAPSLGPYESITDIPIWLPPLPFMIITIVLMIYSFLAWWVLDVKKKSE